MRLTINGVIMALCIGIIVLFIFIGVFADHLAPHDPEKANFNERLKEPSLEYPMGTDQLGRDILSRIIFGTRISLSLCAVIMGFSVAIGITVGLVSGYFGGLVDEVLMRVVDTLLAFPGTLLALAIAGIFGGGMVNLVIALVIVDWTTYARIVRSGVISVKKLDFIKASRGLGFSDNNIIWRHILPNVLPSTIVMVTIMIGHTIISISGLSFLGVGVQPPTPEWGYMLNDGRLYLRSAPYLMIFPGVVIILIALAFNLLGDVLRDRLDPRMRKDVL